MNDKSVVIIGGGVAGMEAAANLVSSGIRVHLIEKESRLGGKVAAWDRLFPARRPAREVIGYLHDKLDGTVNILTEKEIIGSERVDDIWHLSLNDGQALSADALLLTTGFDLFEASKKEEYGYGIYDDVITAADLERKFAAGGLIRNAQGQVPARVGFIHCVGSRDEKVNNLYCSRVCCVTAVKQAVEVREMLPECEVFCFYMDLRMFDLDYEALYKEAQEKWNVQFIRGRLSEAFENPDGTVLIKVEDTLAARPLKMNVGLLVLMTGMVTGAGTKRMIDLLGLRTDENRYLLPRDRMLSANETEIPGLFVAGACTAPRSIDETLADARSASLKIMEYLK